MPKVGPESELNQRSILPNGCSSWGQCERSPWGLARRSHYPLLGLQQTAHMEDGPGRNLEDARPIWADFACVGTKSP